MTKEEKRTAEEMEQSHDDETKQEGIDKYEYLQYKANFQNNTKYQVTATHGELDWGKWMTEPFNLTIPAYSLKENVFSAQGRSCAVAGTEGTVHFIFFEEVDDINVRNVAFKIYFNHPLHGRSSESAYFTLYGEHFSISVVVNSGGDRREATFTLRKVAND